MPLIFPLADHVPLQNPPLQEVVCQIRFPPILKIGEEVNSEFQDKIRKRFPKYTTEQQVQFKPSPGQPLTFVGSKPMIHRFLSKDETCTVSLGVNFFAISTTEYHGWESFADDLGFVTEIVLRVYEIPYATRIGLRYINALNLTSTRLLSFTPDVLEILRPELTALLTRQEIQDPYFAMTHIRSKQNEGELTFLFGITQQDESQEKSFMLDFDRYIEEEIEINTEGLLERCAHYHAEIYNAFRWCISEDKLSVFGLNE